MVVPLPPLSSHSTSNGTPTSTSTGGLSPGHTMKIVCGNIPKIEQVLVVEKPVSVPSPSMANSTSRPLSVVPE
ncbi:hypothetical protein C5E10_00100 [Pseudoclavibacter sp. RFBG4]|nr:hypothetical protein C5E10_00100 [Pseudoclavibacter sp. RFBG4]